MLLAFAVWSDSFTVYVADDALRPIPGASVEVLYQYNSIVGYRTLRFTTGSLGEAHVEVHNFEPQAPLTDYQMKVKVCYDDSCEVKVLTAGEHPPKISFKLPISTVTIILKNAKEMPVVGAEITDGNLTAITDSSGRAVMRLTRGERNLTVSHAGGQTVFNITVENDTTLVLHLSLYTFNITITDDEGNPLNGTVRIGDREFQVMGHYHVEDFPERFPVVQAIFGYAVKELRPDLELQTELEFVFDQTPPRIKRVEANRTSTGILLLVEAEDPGPKASGIPPGGVHVIYRIGNETFTAPATPIGPTSFLAKLPSVQNLTLLYFTVHVSDGDGNLATYSGSLRPSETPGGSTLPPSQEETGQEQGFPILYLAVGGALLLALGALAMMGSSSE